MKKRTKPDRQKISKLKSELDNGQIKRRDFLRKAFTLGLSASASYALLGSSKASAQDRIVTHTIGEGISVKPTGSPQQLTTYAVGEESVNTPPQNLTTYAVGEEGNTYPPQATTYAVGEEGTTRPPQNITTKAVGEEGTTIRPKPTTGAMGEEGNPNLTTYRVGEEGTINPPATTLRVGEEGRTTPITTHALGEEGGGGGTCPRTGQPVNPLPQKIQGIWETFRRW